MVFVIPELMGLGEIRLKNSLLVGFRAALKKRAPARAGRRPLWGPRKQDGTGSYCSTPQSG